MKLKEVLDKTTAFFREKKIESPRLDAELLFSHGLKLERIQLYLKFDQPLSEDELATLRELVRRRGQGEPVAYILGYRDFFGHRFIVDNSTLIPRPETEHLVEEALNWATEKEHEWHLLDLGSGTGCVGLSLLKALPKARLLSVDVSAEALKVAQQNAQKLEVLDRVRFLHADAGDAERVMAAFKDFMGHDSADIILSNPPYIAENDSAVEENVKKYEPSTALFAPDEGLALLKKWSRDYTPYLSKESLFLMEMGMSQGPAMLAHFHGLKTFDEIRVVRDLAELDRVIYGGKNG